jgi:two-component system chemotaxis response regulator CheB
MCVNVFLADDSEIMRNAIRSLLSKREDIAVVGEASNFRETIQKTTELRPDLIILDLNLPDRNYIAPSEAKKLLNGYRVLAITLGTDDLEDPAQELLDSIGAVRLLDKMDLSDQLIPAILELAPAKTAH